jgi:hypothetical protein
MDNIFGGNPTENVDQWSSKEEAKLVWNVIDKEDIAIDFQHRK